MTTSQKRILLERIANLEHDIQELKRVRMELALSGFASASLSSSGGSRSYTRLDLDKITTLISKLQKELDQNNSLLFFGSVQRMIQIPTIYS